MQATPEGDPLAARFSSCKFSIAHLRALGRRGRLPALPDMDVKGFFIMLEASGLSTWVRESPSMLAFPGIIALHAIGMGLLAGTNAAMDFRVLGFAQGVPVSSLDRLVPVMRFGFWLNAISGLLLLIAYPTKALTNPLFYIKLLLIAAAMVNTMFLRKQVIHKSTGDDKFVPANGKILAAASLALWAGAVISGRLLAYTYTYLDSSFGDY